MSMILMPTPAQILATGLLTWFGLLALLIAIRILRRDIQVEGLLTVRSGEQQMAPERVLMMAVFPVALAYYVYTALSMELPVTPEGRPSLPDVPQYVIALLTGTNSLYLAGKFFRGT
jgi:hypothetical protein